MEVGASLAALHLYPMGLFELQKTKRKHSVKSTNPHPILLVHGIMHNRSAFIALKRKMQKLGWDNLETLNYATHHGHIFQMIKELEEKVEKLREETQSAQIDIVAHSLGGIVARAYMSLGEGRGKVRRLVTLGTPHQGTKLSGLMKRMSRGGLHCDLKTGSYFLKLLESTPLPRGSKIVSIYSPFDLTIIPRDNGAAQGSPRPAFENICIDYVGHAGLLYSQEAFDAIVQGLLS
jgi:triacylglycerol esterase/lipase EstA (alpha/beta hydrolase family)